MTIHIKNVRNGHCCGQAFWVPFERIREIGIAFVEICPHACGAAVLLESAACVMPGATAARQILCNFVASQNCSAFVERSQA
jgi:hypothetical protein